MEAGELAWTEERVGGSGRRRKGRRMGEAVGVEGHQGEKKKERSALQ